MHTIQVGPSNEAGEIVAALQVILETTHTNNLKFCYEYLLNFPKKK